MEVLFEDQKPMNLTPEEEETFINPSHCHDKQNYPWNVVDDSESGYIGPRKFTTRRFAQNSSLRVERRKRGSAQRASSSSHEAEGNRELSSARVRSRGRRPRFLTAWESYRAREWRPEAVGRGMSTCEITFSHDHLRPSAANFTRVCMTAFGLRCVYYFIRWEHRNWQLEWL